MNFVISILFFMTLTLGISTQGIFIKTDADLDNHIQNFAEFTQTHHDNIADVEHSHVHKHSDEEEEHEHHHQHSSSPQQTVKSFVSSSFKTVKITYEKIENNYSIKSLVSSEHSLSIFRPPIV